jgi:hypothetical protein
MTHTRLYESNTNHHKMSQFGLTRLSVPCNLQEVIPLRAVLWDSQNLLLECMEGEPTVEKENKFKYLMNDRVGEYLLYFSNYLMETLPPTATFMTWTNEQRQEMKDLLCSDIQALLDQAIVDGTNRPKSYYKGFVVLPLEINDCIEFTNQKIQMIQTQLQSMTDGQHERKLMENMLSNFEKLMPVLVRMEDNKRCAEEYDFYGSCFYQAASIPAQNVMMQTK